jgi:hypothetical protein
MALFRCFLCSGAISAVPRTDGQDGLEGVLAEEEQD